MIDELLPYIAPDKISLVVPFLLWGWIVVSIATLYVIFPETVNRVLRVVLSLILGPIFVLAMLLINPDIAQSIFWWSGMRAYNLPVLFATIYVFVYFFLRRKQNNAFAAFLTGFLIVFFMAGFSEIFSAVQIVFFVGLFSLEMYLDKRYSNSFYKNSTYFLTVGSIVGAALGGFVMVLAPGNFVRQSYFEQPPGIIRTLELSFSGFSNFLLEIFHDEQKVLGLTGAFFIFFCVGLLTRPTQKLPTWLAPLFFVNGFVFMFGCFIPASYATSTLTPYRALSIATYFFLCFFLAAGFTAGQTIQQQSILGQKKQIYLLIIFCVTGTFLISSVANQMQQKWTVYEAEYVLFADKWDRVHKQIVREKNKGETHVFIPPMKNWAKLGDPGQDPAYWINQCYSDYYGIEIAQAPR